MSQIDKLLKGIGILIDDKAKSEEMQAMVKSIEDAGIPMYVLEEIPDTSIIDSLGNTSFIILDWEFDDVPEIEMPDDVELGTEYKREKHQTILYFLKVLLEKCFVPVFIITGQTFQDVLAALSEEGLYSDTAPNKIMVKDKKTIHDYLSLAQNVQEWLEKTPSAYALKLWEHEATIARNRMFLDLDSTSSNWVGLLLDTIRKDVDNNEKAVNHEFGSLLNNNFVNRMHNANYNQLQIQGELSEGLRDTTRKVLQGERYIKYNETDLPEICYTGDLYQANDDSEYYLNIRAQCDLARDDNPKLYVLRGNEVEADCIAIESGIKIETESGNTILHVGGGSYSINNLARFDKEKCEQFNTEICKNKQYVFNNGEIIEKVNHSIVFCVADRLIIEFKYRTFDIIKKNKMEEKARIIGRILPPYITKIQQKYAQYMIRTGVMPIPESLIMR